MYIKEYNPFIFVYVLPQLPVSTGNVPEQEKNTTVMVFIGISLFLGQRLFCIVTFHFHNVKM